MERSVNDLPTIMRLLDEVLDLPEADRLAWLDNLPPDQAHLEPRLRHLLSISSDEDDTANIQGHIASIISQEVLSDEQPELHPGLRVGPYELVREVGQGGMGSVWLAHRADGAFKRDVALKLPHVVWMGHWATRMERERDILASLQHENIARFYDAGVDQSGRPFLAMEYVEGKSIDVYCNEQALSVRERLKLILDVAKAVAHAHSKLVIHRDLKPSNILVTADGAVRLLDFGIATLLTTQDGDSRTRLTQLTGRALTLDYASPEQIRGETIDTASDVYSLAVVTFELLTGARPYRLKRGTVAELEHSITEIEPRQASDSSTDPTIRRQLRGDLDAVLNKAMKKTAAERYPTVAAFADEIDRYLNQLPVLAQPDRLLYRVRKFVARNSWQVGAAALVLISMLAGSAVALWQARTARVEAAHAQTTKNFLISIFRSNDVRVASDKPHAERTVKEVLDAAAGRIEQEFTSDPPTQIELLDLTATMFDNQGDTARSVQLDRRRDEIARKYYGPLHPKVIAGVIEAADAAIIHDDLETSRKLLEESDQLLKRSGRDGGELRADWLYDRGRLAFHTSDDPAVPIDMLERAIGIYRKLGSSTNNYASALSLLAILRADADELEASLALRKEAIRIAESSPDRDDAMLSTFLINLARVQERLSPVGDTQETYRRAQDLTRRTFGIHSYNYWMAMAWGARLQLRNADREGAHALFKSLLEVLPPLGTNTEELAARQIYAESLTAEGRAAEAIPILETAQKFYAANPVYESDLRDLRLSLGDAYDKAGRVADARDTLSTAHADFMAHDRARPQFTQRMRERWGRFLLDHARPDSSDLKDAQTEVEAMIANATGRIHDSDVLAHSDLARLALARGDATTALRESRQALAMLERHQLSDIRTAQQVWLAHSRILLETGNTSEAADWAAKAYDASTRTDDPASPAIAAAKAALTNAKAALQPHT